MIILTLLLIHITHAQNMKSKHIHRCKNHKHGIVLFIPKYVIRQQIGFVSNFLFVIFYGFNKQNMLAKQINI